MTEWLSELQRRLEARVQEELDAEQIRCPSCGYVFDDNEDKMGLVTLWGEDGRQQRECPECELELIVTESVQRTYEVTRATAVEPKEDK